jgi:hypothetical protein
LINDVDAKTKKNLRRWDSDTDREKLSDIGSIQATADTQKTILMPPLLGGLMLVGGIVLVMAGSKKSS